MSPYREDGNHAAFPSFSPAFIPRTDKSRHGTSVLLLSVFLYRKSEERMPMFAMGHGGRTGAHRGRVLGKAMVCGKDCVGHGACV